MIKILTLSISSIIFAALPALSTGIGFTTDYSSHSKSGVHEVFFNEESGEDCDADVPYYFNHTDPFCSLDELKEYCLKMGPPILQHTWPGCKNCCAFHNPQWLTFMTGEFEDNTFSLDLEITECQNNQGVQIALYEIGCYVDFDTSRQDEGIHPTADMLVSSCNLVNSPHVGVVNLTVEDVVPGTIYGLVVDGWANDQCRIDIFDISSGMEPYEIDVEIFGDLLWSLDGIEFGTEDTLVAGIQDVGFKLSNSEFDDCYEFSWYVDGERDESAGDSSSTYFDFDNEGLVEICVLVENKCAIADPICAEVFVGPSPIEVEISCSATCPDDSTGFAEVEIIRGQGPFTYEWSTGDTTASVSNLAADTVCVTVTDSDGYSKKVSCVIDQFDPGDLSISCPHYISIVLPPGDSSMFVELENAAVSYDCGQGVTVENTHTDGGVDASGFFSEGTTIVIYTVEDTLGNQEMCESIVALAPSSEIGGRIYYESGSALEGVDVKLTAPYTGLVDQDITDELGEYLLVGLHNSILTCEPHKNIDHGVGLTTVSVIHLQRHLMGLEPLASPYRIIAADVNNDGKLSSFDLLLLQAVIIGARSEFPNNHSHRFVAADYQFSNPQNPLAEDWPETRTYADLDRDLHEEDWIAVRIGDLEPPTSDFHRYGSGRVDILVSVSENEDGTADLVFSPYRDYHLSGYQLEFHFGNSDAEFMAYNYNKTTLPELGSSNFYYQQDENLLRTNWHYYEDVELKEGEEFFRLQFAPQKEDIDYSKEIKLLQQGSFWPSEAYAGNGNIRLKTNLIWEDMPRDYDFALHPNRPNPFSEATTVVFELPENLEVNIEMVDAGGSLLRSLKIDGFEGENHLLIEDDQLPDGVIYYRLKAGDWSETGKMIHLK